MQRPEIGIRSGAREEAFGRVLADARRKRGLSQEALAFKSGYHRTYISMLERGQKSPSLCTIMDLADTLDVRASHIIARVERLLSIGRKKSTS